MSMKYDKGMIERWNNDESFRIDYFRKQSAAIRGVSQAVKAGHLPHLKTEPITCADCYDRATCYDHRDYRHPLTVDAVCQSCNVKRGMAVW